MMRRRYRKRWYLAGIIGVLLLGSLLGWLLASNEPETPLENKEAYATFAEDPLTLKDYVQADVAIADGNLIMTSNCTALALSVTAEKAYSIQRGIMQKNDVRPNEHDLMKEALEHFGIDAITAKIDRIEKDVYYADLFVKKEQDVLVLDVKPSDAIAIAERFGAPIFIKKDLIDTYGQKTC